MGRKFTVTVFLDPEDYNTLVDLSRKTGDSLSALIREAVKRYLKEVQGGFETTKEGEER